MDVCPPDLCLCPRLSRRPEAGHGLVAGGQQGSSQRGRGPAGGQLAALMENGRRVMTDIPAWGICVMKNQCCPAEHYACLRGQEFARLGDTMTWHEAGAESHSLDPSVASSSCLTRRLSPDGLCAAAGWVRLVFAPRGSVSCCSERLQWAPCPAASRGGSQLGMGSAVLGSSARVLFSFPRNFFFLPDSSADSTDILKIFQFQPY